MLAVDRVDELECDSNDSLRTDLVADLGGKQHNLLTCSQKAKRVPAALATLNVTQLPAWFLWEPSLPCGTLKLNCHSDSAGRPRRRT